MMLNGLQTLFKALPLDGLVAKLQSMDTETTEPVSFGELLKLKEKQLQLEQEVSASFVAAAFASLQTPQPGTPILIQNMDTVETATKAEVSKAAMNAIPQVVTNPIERSDILSLTQTPASQDDVTESIHSLFPAVFDSVKESTSQEALAKPEPSDALSATSFGKTITSPPANAPTTQGPSEFTEQDFTAKVAKLVPAKEQVVASTPSLKAETISARGAIHFTEPETENRAPTISSTAKAPIPAWNTETTTQIDAAGKAMNAGIKTASQTTENLEISTRSLQVNFVTSEDKTSERIDPKTDSVAKTFITPNKEDGTKVDAILAFDGIKSSNSDTDPYPKPLFEILPNQEADESPFNLPDEIAADRQESGLQTLKAAVTSPATKVQSAETIKTSEFGNESAFTEPQIKENIHFYQKVPKNGNTLSGPLPVTTTKGVPTRNAPTETDNSTIQQVDASFRGQQSKSSAVDISAPSLFSPNENETEMMDKQIASPTEDEIIAGVWHLHNTVDEIVSSPEIELVDHPVNEPTLKQQIAVPTNVDPGSIEVAPANSKVDFPINLNSLHEFEMSAVGNYGQTIQSPAIPAIKDVPLADDLAGVHSISVSKLTGDRLSALHGKIDLKNTFQGPTGLIDGMADSEKETPGTANTFESNATRQFLSTESRNIRSETGRMTSSIEIQNPSPVGDSSDPSSTFTENTPRFSQLAGASQGMEMPKTAAVEMEGSSASENPGAETGTRQTPGQPEFVNDFRPGNDVPGIVPIKPAKELISGEPVTSSSERVVARPSDVQVTDFEINAEKIATEPHVEEKVQGNVTNLSNVDAAVLTEQLETPDVNTATVMEDFLGAENFTSQSRYVVSDKTADLMGHVLSKTDFGEGNKDVTDEELPVRESSIPSNGVIETGKLTGNQVGSEFSHAKIEKVEKSDFSTVESQSPLPGKTANMVHDGLEISADSYLSKSSTDDNTRVQKTQDTKTPETTSQASDESSFQPEMTKPAGSKDVETQVHVEMTMDRSAQNGTIQFHKNKSKLDVVIKPADPNSSDGEFDERTNTDSESTNDVRPATRQASGVFEIVKDPIAPVLPKAHTVEGPEVIRKLKETENGEKTLPVEKQPRLNQTPGIAAPVNGPVKDAMVTHPGGNIPLNQLHGDVQELVDHMIGHINSNLKDGPTSMRLQLSPRGLGTIDVQMVNDSQGVHVTFFAEQASTGKLLGTQLEQLRVSLVDSGVHLSGLDIGQQSQSGQKGGGFEQSPNFTRDLSRNFPEAQTVSQERPSLERSLGRSSDIDYFI